VSSRTARATQRSPVSKNQKKKKKKRKEKKKKKKNGYLGWPWWFILYFESQLPALRR
jgi:hypothetical protein